MDTSDPYIQFDRNGVCNHCHEYDRMVTKELFVGKDGERQLERIVSKIKQGGKGKPYDCVIGVSGGVDSTFVAYKVVEMGLHPLAVHLDNGWDSELAVSNIHQVLNTLQVDLHTLVIDWEEFKDLQVAFLKASTPDSEIPSDHAIAALMHHTANRIGIRYVISGRNVRTESHGTDAWSTGHFDWKYIWNVHKKFGKRTIRSYPHLTLLEAERYRYTQTWVNILNYIDYIKRDAMKILEKELGWQYYGGKHYESIYTRFFQGYILPVKFGFDKRKAHLSSLICSGETTREEALEELRQPTYAPKLQEEDRAYVTKKLGLSEDEFEKIMLLPKKSIYDYPSYAADDKIPLLFFLRRIPSIARLIYRRITTLKETIRTQPNEQGLP